MSLAYVGGKFRQSKVWAPLILNNTSVHHTRYVEPFVGGASMLEKIAPHFKEVYAGDVNESLVLMWQDVQSGKAANYPTEVSANQHAALKNAIPTGVRAFVGFGCSFAGMWFATYHDGAAKTKRAILKSADAIKHVQFHHKSYELWDACVVPNTVVYCDPPYAGTMRFKANGPAPFDYEKFWATMESWRQRGASVFVSEYRAPSGWDCVSELDLAKTVSSTKTGQRQLDKLWR